MAQHLGFGCSADQQFLGYWRGFGRQQIWKNEDVPEARIIKLEHEDEEATSDDMRSEWEKSGLMRDDSTANSTKLNIVFGFPTGFVAKKIKQKNPCQTTSHSS